MSPDSPFIGNIGGLKSGGNAAERLENWLAAAEDRDNDGCGNTGRGTIDDDALFLD